MKEKKDLLRNITQRDRNNPEMDVQQFEDEIETWKRLLNSRMEENVLLKIQISNILRDNYDQNLLEEIEEFQTRFIREDELIQLLRRWVNELGNIDHNNILEDRKLQKSLDLRMEDLRKHITDSTIRFRILQSTFDDFQNKIIE